MATRFNIWIVLFMGLCMPAVQAAVDEKGVEQATRVMAPGAPGKNETTVTSEKFQLDLKKGVGTFVGNVKVTNPRFSMNSTELVVELSENGEPTRFLASGDIHINHSGRIATARKAEYNISEKRIILTGDPQVEQENNRVTGNTIILYPDSDRMDVQGRTTVKLYR